MFTSCSSILRKRINLLVFAVIILVCRLSTVSFTHGDDGFYNNLGSHIMRGELPFYSYFFAHPPLFLLLAPFTFNLTAIRLALALTQIVLLIVFDSLLVHYGHGLFKRTVIDGLLLLSTSFVFFYNNNLSFGLLMIWLLLSYYHYLKGNVKWSVFFASIAVLTRLFALFYILPMIYVTFKEHRLVYAYSLIPLIILILVVPHFLQDVFLYHVDGSTGKTKMYDSDRFFYLYLFTFTHVALIPLALLMVGDKDLALLAMCMTAGVFVMSNVYLMYFAVLTPLWLLAALNKVTTKQLLLVSVLFLVASQHLNVKIVDDSMTVSEVNDLTNLISSYDLPITGCMGMINLVQWVNPEINIIGSVEEPAGVMDTLWHRTKHQVPSWQANVKQYDHLFLCVPAPESYENECELMQGMSYELLGVYPEYKNLHVYYYNKSKGGENK